MRAIILAAGQGKRMMSSMQDLPKCLTPINNTTVLERLIRQMRSYGIDDITIVVGYNAHKVIDYLNEKVDHDIDFVINDRFREDVNILSLALAFEKKAEPCFVFEADCVFENKCFEIITDPQFQNESVWYSCGDFLKDMYGGILKADSHDRIVDIKIIDKYDDLYSDYKKMIGVMKIGPDQVDLYSTRVIDESKINTRQYYHMPWINALDDFDSYLCDMGHLRLSSFNTLQDYQRIKDLFADEAD